MLLAASAGSRGAPAASRSWRTKSTCVVWHQLLPLLILSRRLSPAIPKNRASYSHFNYQPSTSKIEKGWRPGFSSTTSPLDEGHRHRKETWLSSFKFGIAPLMEL